LNMIDLANLCGIEPSIVFKNVFATLADRDNSTVIH
jgi:hypothetical protein